MDRSRSPPRGGGSDRMAPSTAELEAWAGVGRAAGAVAELCELVAARLPGPTGQPGKWKALCLRRDARALLRARPAQGANDLPIALVAARHFHAGVIEALTRAEQRMAELACGMPLNRIFGAWEGTLPADEVPPGSVSSVDLPRVVAAFNVRGACGRAGGLEAHDQRLLGLTASLQAAGVALAILAEPRFGPGMVWPEWTGYEFFGERESEAASVAALILREASASIAVIPGVGDARAVWVELEAPKPGLASSGTGQPGHGVRATLVLGVYAPHAHYDRAVRQAFWDKRLSELRSLRARVRFADHELVVLGDFNLHLGELADANVRYEQALDRDVFTMLQARDGFDCTIRNPCGVATHVSGTAVDVVMATRAIDLRVEVEVVGGGGVPSDHARLLVRLRGSFHAREESRLGVVRWDPEGAWDEALVKVPRSEHFIVGLGRMCL